MMMKFCRIQLHVLKKGKKNSCIRFLEKETSVLPCSTEELETDSLIKCFMIVAMEKGRQLLCLSLKTMEIVLEVIQRLSGRVMTAPRQILAPSSSLSPINDPIRSSNQIGLSTVARIGDHNLEGHYLHMMNNLTKIKSVSLILINLRMSV